MASLHHKQFVGQDLRLSLVDNAPGILGIACHHFVKGAPEVLRLLRSGGGRGSRELAVLGINGLRAITRSFQLLFVFVNGIGTFGTEELQRVIAKNIGVGQNFVISQVLLMFVDCELSVSLDRLTCAASPRDGAVQHLLQIQSVVVQNCRCFDPERVHHLAAFLAHSHQVGYLLQGRS